MGKHTSSTGHADNTQQGGSSDPNRATRHDHDGFAVGRPGKPDNYTER
jgi:hypothetical protein